MLKCQSYSDLALDLGTPIHKNDIREFKSDNASIVLLVVSKMITVSIQSPLDVNTTDVYNVAVTRTENTERLFAVCITLTMMGA